MGMGGRLCIGVRGFEEFLYRGKSFFVNLLLFPFLLGGKFFIFLNFWQGRKRHFWGDFLCGFNRRERYLEAA